MSKKPTPKHFDAYGYDIKRSLSAIANEQKLVAIDIGSNSFHLAIGRLDHGEVRKVLSLSEKVQLAAGLDDNNQLSAESIARGLACLASFATYLEGIDPANIRIVATNALRKATNRSEFIEQANQLLPVPIEVIAGREEGRLIYLGVSHTNASEEKRLVIDIGGGSTEFIIGEGFRLLEVESLQMGCVAFGKKFFSDGKISKKAFVNAMNASKNELFTIAKRYKKISWTQAIGSSGTIKACALAIKELGLAESITLPAMRKLQTHLIDLGDSDAIDLACVKPHRKKIFAAGVAELLAIMQVLDIRQLAYSDGALREGVMYDMLGRQADENVQQRSLKALAKRYSVSAKQAQLVKDTCKRLLDDNQKMLGLTAHDQTLLLAAAQLHETGLAISHSHYHKHSSYLLKYADMFGFSHNDQNKMACLVLYCRRKLVAESVAQIESLGGKKLLEMCLLLRLAVLANQSRSRHSAKIRLNIDKKSWQITVENGNHQALLLHQLNADASQWAKWGVKLIAGAAT